MTATSRAASRRGRLRAVRAGLPSRVTRACRRVCLATREKASLRYRLDESVREDHGAGRPRLLDVLEDALDAGAAGRAGLQHATLDHGRHHPVLNAQNGRRIYRETGRAVPRAVASRRSSSPRRPGTPARAPLDAARWRPTALRAGTATTWRAGTRDGRKSKARADRVRNGRGRHRRARCRLEVLAQDLQRLGLPCGERGVLGRHQDRVALTARSRVAPDAAAVQFLTGAVQCPLQCIGKWRVVLMVAEQVVRGSAAFTSPALARCIGVAAWPGLREIVGQLLDVVRQQLALVQRVPTPSTTPAPVGCRDELAR